MARQVPLRELAWAIKARPVTVLFVGPTFPDLPTIGEFYPGFLVTSWNGFFAPTGTPQPIVRLLARETRNAAKDPAIADRLLKLGIEPSGADPEEFAEVIRVERDFYRAAAAAAGIKME